MYNRSGGGQLALHALTADGKYLLACVAQALRVYSAATGEHLFSLDHNGEVVAMSLHPSHAHQVYAATQTGQLVLWDLTTASVVRTLTVPAGVHSMAAGREQAFLACHWRGSEAGRVMACDLLKGEAAEHRAKVSSPRELALSGNGEWLATVDRHTLLLWHVADLSRPALALTHTKPLTCVAVSSHADKVAAGDATGRIVVWHDAAAAARARLDNGEQQQQQEGLPDGEDEGPPQTTVHWHAQEVCCLAFSIDDAYLLSGGHEAVLVMWDVTSGNRMYLPRLGGPLVGIARCSSDAAKYAIRQADNTLRVVNMATLRVESSVHGLRPPPQPPTPAGVAPLMFQPRTGLLAAAGSQCMLQFYDVLRDVHVDKLQLSVRNVGLIAGAQDVQGAAALEPAATHLVFSSDGSVLVTVESCCAPGSTATGGTSETLKFWDRKLGLCYGSPYVLAASAEEPHRSAAGSAPITGLAYHPTADMATTTSGTEFRVWRREAPAKEPKGVSWTCQAVASYRGERISAPVYSPDGSLLAVAAGGTIALWDAYEMTLAGLMPLPETGAATADVRQLEFLSCSQRLVALTRSGLAVLDILTSSVVWALNITLSALAVDPASDHFAAVVHEAVASKAGAAQAVVLFDGSSKRPVRAWRLTSSATDWTSSIQLAFMPPGTLLTPAVGEQAWSPLIALSGSREYVVLAAAGSRGAEDQVQTARTLPPVERMSSFAAKFGGLGVSQRMSAVQAAEPVPVGGMQPFAFSTTPSHVLPSVQELCPDFLSRLLQP